jgi:hypothetical protein
MMEGTRTMEWIIPSMGELATTNIDKSPSMEWVIAVIGEEDKT